VRDIEARGEIAEQEYQIENPFPNDGLVEPVFDAMS
jgi:hypothetical protein